MASPGEPSQNPRVTDDLRTRDDRPGTRWTSGVLVVGVLAILALNNPTEADARRFIAERVNDSIRAARDGKIDAQIADAAPALALLTGMLDSTFTVQRRNLVIASHYTIKPSALLETLHAAAGQSGSLGELCLIGVFGTFLPCGAKGAIAERLMRDGHGSSAADATGADTSADTPPPPPPQAAASDDPEVLESEVEEAAPLPAYDEVSDRLLTIGVRVRAGEFDAAEQQIDEVARLSLSPEDRAIVANLRQRIATGRRAGATVAREARPAASANRVAPRIDVRRSPSTDDFYPASARRAEIEGKTTIRACVAADGRMVGEPTVTESSGTTVLDQAAVAWARRARFTPGTEDGDAVEMCTQFRINFKLTG